MVYPSPRRTCGIPLPFDAGLAHRFVSAWSGDQPNLLGIAFERLNVVAHGLPPSALPRRDGEAGRDVVGGNSRRLFCRGASRRHTALSTLVRFAGRWPAVKLCRCAGDRFRTETPPKTVGSAARGSHRVQRLADCLTTTTRVCFQQVSVRFAAMAACRGLFACSIFGPG